MIWNGDTSSLDIQSLHAAYRSGACSPNDVAQAVLQRIARGDSAIWISRVSAADLVQRAQQLESTLAAQADPFSVYPLLGIPFAIKDNIDVVDMQTTAACPAFAYTARRTASVVARLLSAGSMLVGKTNLDQFATGLVGIRSPYGVPRNPFDAAYIPGGSSSGSALAVATGLVSFALGTDTAGSGRVPAALNNIVGLKPTRGLLSGAGLLPACRSLDCVSVFALDHADALAVADVAAGFDTHDPFSRAPPRAQRLSLQAPPTQFRFAVPRHRDLQFFGDLQSENCYAATIEQMTRLGGTKVEIDFQPFRDAADLLYQGPWIVERILVVGALLERDPQAIHADVRAALSAARQFDVKDAFKGYYRLKELRRTVEEILAQVDCLMVPTIGRPFRLDEVAENPAGVNSDLGYYTNFVNLLDLCAVAVPAGFMPSGLPFGVTLIGLPFTENNLSALGDALHRKTTITIGALSLPLPEHRRSTGVREDRVRLCVSGAHMSGLPLNPQLLHNQAQLIGVARTAPYYRLYALNHMNPPRPGMVRVRNGVAIEIEIWEMPKDRFGWFVAGIPAPLGIGQIELASGESIHGFLCETYAAQDAEDISAAGGWRAYLSSGLSV